MPLILALQSLNSVCRETVFQARAQAPIQVMGVLEAAELEFDHVWLAGFDEQAWPRIAPANPLIPVSTQIESGIPSATLSLQTQLAEMKTGQLCALSEDVIYSHARIQGDIELDVSPALPAKILSDLAELPAIFSLDNAIRTATPPLQTRIDDMGFPYLKDTARGGTGLVQKQSACPFSAYAKYRLNAEEDDEPQIGMNNLQRGGLLHKILETIWQVLKNSTTLCRHIEQGMLGDLIQQHIQTQLHRFAAYSGLGEGFIRAETQRLHTLITEWLNLEAQRPPFTVAATEMKCEHHINGLSLKLSLDRVDQIGNPDTGPSATTPLLVMDYKSGNCKLKDWEGQRPDQPQLPLYFLALERNSSFGLVDALSFAQVKSGLCQFIGVSRTENTLPDVGNLEALPENFALKKDIGEWSQLKPMWETRIGKLVEDYQQGFAQVDPKSIQSCHFCSFGPLCRIHTRRTGRDEDG